MILCEEFENNKNICFEGTKFKFSESTIFEYKVSINQQSGFQKYLETICAFLNTKGGYLIFGINDNLNLSGLSIANGEIDKFILKIDNIISTNQIIGRTNKNTTVRLTTKNLTLETITNSQKKKFVIIKAVPSPDVSYQLDNGKKYFRLGASNLYDKEERFYKQADLETAIRNAEEKYKTENNNNIKMFQENVEKYQEEIKNLKEDNKYLNDQIRNYESEVESLKNYKEEQETLIYANKKIGLFDFVLYCFPCFSKKRKN
jgi:predicted HTH transcriptional regulator